MEMKIPELSLILLMGTSGSGKTTFAKKHFLETEVVSSDFCRALVSDDESNMDATNDAFDVLQEIVKRRLKRGKLTVIDATNIQKDARAPLLRLAKKYHFFSVIVVLDLPEKVCQKYNEQRSGRQVKSIVIHNQRQQLKLGLKQLKHEGFRFIYKLTKEEDISNARFIKQPLWNNKKNVHGPFDLIGDVHGCFEELCSLLQKLGYAITKNETNYIVVPPTNRKAVFVGDFIDRGPFSCEVLRLVMDMVNQNVAICVPGNHDVKLLRKLKGNNVQIKHGLAETLQQLEEKPQEFIDEVMKFIDSLISHYILDDGNLVVAHAGIKENMQGRGSKAVRDFCLYGETTGETDEFGLPVRFNWAEEYKGKAIVVYGHTPVPTPEWFNNTINIDTGCVFGGKLTALRYPERETVSVDSQKLYCEPMRPIGTGMVSSPLTIQQQYDDILNIEDYLGKIFIETPWQNVTIREENTLAALEVMSRFALHPKWLIYLPPTMSPCETSAIPEYLEHPQEALKYYQNNNVESVVCEEKHMGSRAVVIICKNKEAVYKRFGLEQDILGVCYTRTGRNFFDDKNLETDFLKRLNNALTKANFWEEHHTDWVCLDCELMPWSAKAQLLLQNQYAAVSTSANIATTHVLEHLQKAQNRNVAVEEYISHYQQRQDLLKAYTKVYREYCWPVNSVTDLKLAPFHILATEGKVYYDKKHTWHMNTIAKFCAQDPKMLMATRYHIINLNDPEQVAFATSWWDKLTAEGGEGMVIKPLDYVAYNGKKLLQPAVKCRGREYLRITYGPEYTLTPNITKLKVRGLGLKQTLALKEFSLGMESLQRFVNREPLRRIHECVFGILALESETVDPRL